MNISETIIRKIVLLHVSYCERKRIVDRAHYNIEKLEWQSHSIQLSL